MRPQCGFLLGGLLKHEVDRKSCKVSLVLFVESFGRHAIEGRQIAIEKNILMSEDHNGFRNRIDAQLFARGRSDIALFDTMIDNYRTVGLLPA